MTFSLHGLVISNGLQDALDLDSHFPLSAKLGQVQNDEYWDDNKSPRKLPSGIMD